MYCILMCHNSSVQKNGISDGCRTVILRTELLVYLNWRLLTDREKKTSSQDPDRAECVLNVPPAVGALAPGCQDDDAVSAEDHDDDDDGAARCPCILRFFVGLSDLGYLVSLHDPYFPIYYHILQSLYKD